MSVLSISGGTRRRPFKASFTAFIAALSITLILGGCTNNNYRFANRAPAWGDTLQRAAEAPTIETARPEPIAEPPIEDSTSTKSPDFFKPGTDLVARKIETFAAAREQSDGEIKLNFQNANLLEVIKIVLGDTLQINYTVDPNVQGTVSMQTMRALRREDLIPTLELLLRMNDAALVTTDGLYRVVPLSNALAETRAPQLGDSKLPLPIGFSVRVVPLRYVSAEEMSQILTPLVSGANQLLRVDSARNLLVVASAGADLDRLLETIEVFDVDRMAGMSVALFTPDFVDASTLADDLERLLNDPDRGLMPGLVRFIVVERINGLMVVTSRAEHLARVREWVHRLDRNTGDATPRLFIYRVQNGKAVDLASVLAELFNAGSESSSEPASLAPGLNPVTIGQSMDVTEPGGIQTINEGGDAIAESRPESASLVGATAEGLRLSRGQKVQVIADEPNNALLILARGTEYRQILAALRQLDVSPLQVLVEVTIAEVTLTDNLSFGVEWFFKNSVGSKTGLGTLDLGAAGIGAIQPGFSYAISGGDGVVNFVLNTLASESNLSIISSPSLLVLNNHEATIQVGDEVPITTQQQQSTVADSNIINSIEYRNTGILLTVKPRVNAGGLVIMEVAQEASQVPSTGVADPLTPRIQQRKISSTVAVNSGDTIILGGLIQDGRDLSESGLPGFHKIPFLGALFGTKADNQARTELIVLITPRAVSNSTAALQVTEEYRQRLKKLIPSREPIKRTPVDPQYEPMTEASNQPVSAAPETYIAPYVPGSNESGWAVQVGSFQDAQQARALSDQLSQAGLPTPAPQPVTISGSTWYRVYVGPESDREGAEALLSRVKAVADLNGTVIRYK